MFGDICSFCEEEMKSPYTFKDSRGNWHTAHKMCCNQLKREIEKQIGLDNMRLSDKR